MEQAKVWFEEHLKNLLVGLYDPATLRENPVTKILGADRRGDPITILRDLLLAGIESLKPDSSIPRGSRTWRAYSILRRRYVEQVPQEMVARDMGLSVRQLQREEKLARQVLVDRLWSQYHLEQYAGQMTYTLRTSEESSVEDHSPLPAAREQELEWLRESMVFEVVHPELLIQDILDTAAPILVKNCLGHRLESTPVGGTVALPAAVLRQALLNVVAVLAKNFPGGRMLISIEMEEETIRFLLECQFATPLNMTSPTDTERLYRQYESAIFLMKLFEGTLQVGASGKGILTVLKIPIRRHTPVLVVDDNADSLQLMERYLSGSSYRFVGLMDAQQVVEKASEIRPGAIVLDVMMPEKDGWNLLGQLRQHPTTRGIPVIICTILAQHDLALALGADDFLRKPIRRQTLLECLNRVLASQSKDAG